MPEEVQDNGGSATASTFTVVESRGTTRGAESRVSLESRSTGDDESGPEVRPQQHEEELACSIIDSKDGAAMMWCNDARFYFFRGSDKEDNFRKHLQAPAALREEDVQTPINIESRHDKPADAGEVESEGEDVEEKEEEDHRQDLQAEAVMGAAMLAHTLSIGELLQNEKALYDKNFQAPQLPTQVDSAELNAIKMSSDELFSTWTQVNESLHEIKELTDRNAKLSARVTAVEHEANLKRRDGGSEVDSVEVMQKSDAPTHPRVEEEPIASVTQLDSADLVNGDNADMSSGSRIGHEKTLTLSDAQEGAEQEGFVIGSGFQQLAAFSQSFVEFLGARKSITKLQNLENALERESSAQTESAEVEEGYHESDLEGVLDVRGGGAQCAESDGFEDIVHSSQHVMREEDTRTEAGMRADARIRPYSNAGTGDDTQAEKGMQEEIDHDDCSRDIRGLQPVSLLSIDERLQKLRQDLVDHSGASVSSTSDSSTEQDSVVGEDAVANTSTGTGRAPMTAIARNEEQAWIRAATHGAASEHDSLWTATTEKESQNMAEPTLYDTNVAPTKQEVSSNVAPEPSPRGVAAREHLRRVSQRPVELQEHITKLRGELLRLKSDNLTDKAADIATRRLSSDSMSTPFSSFNSMRPASQASANSSSLPSTPFTRPILSAHASAASFTSMISTGSGRNATVESSPEVTQLSAQSLPVSDIEDIDDAEAASGGTTRSRQASAAAYAHIDDVGEAPEAKMSSTDILYRQWRVMRQTRRSQTCATP